MVCPKSSMGEISSKISSSPAISGTSLRPASLAPATRAFQASLPNSQSKLSVCNPMRFGTSRGSEICANEMRRDAERLEMESVREAAKGGPFP